MMSCTSSFGAEKDIEYFIKIEFNFLTHFCRIDVTSSNSETSSTESDFTVPAPVSTSANFSSPSPNSFQLIVKDISQLGMYQDLKVIRRVHLMISSSKTCTLCSM